VHRVPALAAAATFAIGLVNLASALTPNVAWRGHLLLQAVPIDDVPLFHAFAAPLSVGLVVCSFALRRRRRRAWMLAFGLLLLLGVLDVVKGLDFEEAVVSWAGAALLWRARHAFCVEHEAAPGLRVLGAAAAVSAAAVGLLVWLASGRADDGVVLHETLRLFSFTDSSSVLTDELAWLPAVIGALTIALILAGSWLFFRPRRPSSELPDASARRHALELVRAHGQDTLSYFKLRRDVQYLFSDDRRAFLAYRVENGVLVVSGDPVGPADALPPLIEQARAFAFAHDLRLGVVGASGALAELWRAAGVNAMYIGDEAIVDTSFSLVGRDVRKVRQSVSRLEKAGFAVEVRDVASLDTGERTEIAALGSRWLDGESERGFAMAMDDIEAGVVTVAKDASGKTRALLHFVPSPGRAAMSLSSMRRDRATPNGLMEFAVVRTLQALCERGIDEVSLNFVAFGRLRSRRVLRRLLTIGDRWFQIESLYRFTAKFKPRWEPRYFVFDAFTRSGFAVLRTEGLL
jgi:lysyl-tRNA synthetase class 2